jgi:hypothetical protein
MFSIEIEIPGSENATTVMTEACLNYKTRHPWRSLSGSAYSYIQLLIKDLKNQITLEFIAECCILNSGNFNVPGKGKIEG